MSDLTIRTWTAREKTSFDNFGTTMATRFEGGIMRAICEKLRNELKRSDSAKVTVPWGTYSVTTKTKGETGNITPMWEPSKGFLKALAGDFDEVNADDCITQDEFDPEFFKLFQDYVAYGFFYPEAPENKERINKNKGVKLTDDEAVYFLNSYAMVLATIGRDKQRDGKIFRLEIDADFQHGSFDFEYKDDEIKVTFVPSKVFKQLLKDDAAASDTADADDCIIKSGETRRTEAMIE